MVARWKMFILTVDLSPDLIHGSLCVYIFGTFTNSD